MGLKIKICRESIPKQSHIQNCTLSKPVKPNRTRKQFIQSKMRFLFLFVTALVSGRLETSIKPSVVTWLVDGTNVQCCSGKGGKKEREEIIQELERIASPDVSTFATDQRIANVVLVFDGDLDEAFDKIVLGPWFQIIITDGAGKRKDRADDYIINDALPELHF